MSYEVRWDGHAAESFPTTEAALARVREILKADPDADPEIIDTRTGRAFEAAASKRWRDELSHKIGY